MNDIDSLTYEGTQDGQKVKVTRYPPSDGKGLNRSYNQKTGKPKKRKKNEFGLVDDKLRNMELMLKKIHEEGDHPESEIKIIEAAIIKRKKELGVL